MTQHGSNHLPCPADPDAPDKAPDRPEPEGRSRYDLLIFLAIVACAFGLRLVYVLQLRHSPLFDTPSMDALYHDQWAQAIAKGETFVAGPYFRAPLYPAFLGLIYKVAGHDYLVPRLVQGLLGSLSCGLVFLIGRRVFGRGVGAVAGFAAATYWMLIYFDAELLIPVLIVFLDLLMILLLLRAVRKPGWLSFGLPGLVLGLSAIARPNVLPFAPAVVLWLVVLHRPAWRRVVLYAGCFTVGCLLPVLPVTVRNFVMGDDLVLIASQGGVNFYIGNNPDSDGHAAIVPGTPGDWWGGYHASIARAEEALGRELKPSEVSSYYLGQAFAFFRDQPDKALGLMARKLWLFWNVREISNNKGIYFWTERFTPVVKWLPLNFAVVGPLGLLGLVLCWRRRGELFPIWGFVLVYMVSVVLFFCTARYRAPLLGPLMLLGAYAVFGLVGAVRKKRWGALVQQLAVLVAAAGLVNVVPARGQSRNDAQDLRRLGLAYQEKGQLDKAAEQFRAAVAVAPNWLTVRYNLGTTLAQLGQGTEAVQQLRFALSLATNLGPGETDSVVAGVHHNLANVLRQLGQNEEAAQHYRRATELDPGGGEALTYLRLGNTLAELGRPEAIEAFTRCLSIDPQNVDAINGLVRALIREARYREAIGVLTDAAGLGVDTLTNDLAWLLAVCPEAELRDGARAVRLATRLCPETTDCQPTYLDTLAAALAEAGRFDEAVKVARQALDLARTAGDESLAESLTSRLQLYEAGQPYHEPSP